MIDSRRASETLNPVPIDGIPVSQIPPVAMPLQLRPAHTPDQVAAKIGEGDPGV